MASAINRIAVDGEELEMANYVKYLGIMIDYKLITSKRTWTMFVKKKQKKLESCQD